MDKTTVRQHGVNADVITVRIPLTIKIDVPTWELTYGVSGTDTASDVAEHLTVTIRETVRDILAQLGAGAELA